METCGRIHESVSCRIKIRGLNMGNKAKYKPPDLTVVLSVVDCLTSSVGWYDNDVTDVDWDIIDSEKTM